MRKVCTGQTMRDSDRYAIESLKIPGILLMEAASRAASEEILKRSQKGQRILVLAGAGNNGGDGFAIARMLKRAGRNVKVYCLTSGDKLRGDAKTNFDMLASYKIPVIRPDQVYVIEDMITQMDWVVDALFGTGLDRNVDGIVKQLIQLVNNYHEQGAFSVCSIDIPSGIHSDNGKVMGIAVKADLTVTFAALKAGLLLYPGRDYAGEILQVPIGFPEEIPPLKNTRWFTLNQQDIPELLPKRFNRSHKGSYGRLLVAAGSKNMTGAAVLASTAAYKAGTGLVDMAVPKDIRTVVQGLLPEAVITPYEVIKQNLDHGSSVAPQDLAALKEVTAISSAVLMGPGWSQVCYVTELMETLLTSVAPETTLIMDADALNLLASDDHFRELLLQRDGAVILTPHMGEASRLLKVPVAEIAADPVTAVKALSEKYHAVAALKDALTLVASPDGSIYFNSTGNHGMATAGSGDVLAGLISGLAAQGLDPFQAAYLGVYLHGAAGDRAAETAGHYGLMASDICKAIHLEILSGNEC